MTDYSLYPNETAEPSAPDIITAFRAVGYSIETAIADILDNSISAAAHNIWIDFQWRGADTLLSIRDDGRGMTKEEIVNAMRLGSADPDQPRDSKDLGRFGLGLKTASFSQCRVFTVVSRIAGQEAAFWTWDMDYIRNYARKWQLIGYLPEGDWKEQLGSLSSGTIVIWSNIDRLLKKSKMEDKKAFDRFLEVMGQVKAHVAMVFHRFVTAGRIKIFLNQREIEAWDPFMTIHPATQSFPEDPVQGGLVRLHGFVLPHKSRLTEGEFTRAEGSRGWNAQQGFYIYRNERMLVAGDWLGFYRKEEHYKLARIMLDLPNSLDEDWQLDIKKSMARPPGWLREQLRAYAAKVRLQAAEVYRHKGKVLQREHGAGTPFHHVWLEKVKHGKRSYEINREHPFIRRLDMRESGPLLRLLEETIPVPLIFMRESENPDSFTRPFEAATGNELNKVLEIVYASLLNKHTAAQAKSILLLSEPFNEYPEIIASL
jgi:hypothetical protein